MQTIRIDALQKKFGAVFRLGPLNIAADAGEILAIMGPGGAGKTTLLRILWGFIRPDEGRVTVLGFRPHLDQLRVRSRAGFVPENPPVYEEMTAMTFLHFIGNFYEKWDAELASIMLDEFRMQPQTPLRNASKSDRMKLALVAATGHRPSVLILDEPTTDVDAVIRADILRFLRRLAKEEGATILLSTRIEDDLDQIADTVLMLDKGQAIEYAPQLQLFDKYKMNCLEAIFSHAAGTPHRS